MPVSRDARGRIALPRWFDETLGEQFTGTAPITGSHIIEFEDADHARAVVHSRSEHETGDDWMIMTMMYRDHDERIDARWFFRRRLPLHGYATEVNAPPVGDTMRWPGREPWGRSMGRVLAQLAGILVGCAGSIIRRCAGSGGQLPLDAAWERSRVREHASALIRRGLA